MKARGLAPLASALLLAACAQLAPLREPPPSASDETIQDLATRDEVIARLGRPEEIRALDEGDVLVYRRQTVVDANPNRFYGTAYGTQYVRYERVLFYLDRDGKVVRRAVEPE